MGSDIMKLTRWKTSRTFIDERGDIYYRKDKGIIDNIRWFKCDFVDVPIIDSKFSQLLEEEYLRISGA
jgi:hypothetical protein